MILKGGLSGVRLRKVRGHSVCSENIPNKLKKYEELDELWQVFLECDRAIVATKNREIVGILRFNVDGFEFGATGTWVHKRYRKKGLGTKLWEYALGRGRYQTIYVVPGTSTGKKFIMFLKVHFGERYEFTKET